MNRKKWWIWAGMALFLISGCSFLGFSFLNEPLPEGKAGPEADALARKVLAATGYEHWEQTGAASWNFRGTHDYLWDVKRNYARVSWKNNVVLLDLSTQQGIAYDNGKVVEDATDLTQKAWSRWCNDSFWFMAHHKLFDPGTTRKLVKLEDGKEALLISYLEGGVTPGDSYLWLLDEDFVPTGWKMWVKVFPVGGTYTSWENWQTLSTGVRVAADHKTDVFGVPILEPKAVATLEELTGGEDIFAPLVASLTLPQSR